MNDMMSGKSRTHPRPKEQGTILIVAMILTTLAIVIVADLRTVTRVEWEAATNADIDFILDAALRAGYQIAEAHLRQDSKDAPEVDHLLEEWAGTDGFSKVLDPSEYGEVAYQENLGSGGGSTEENKASIPELRIFIEDEERKYPLPLLVKGADSLQDRRRKSFSMLLQIFRRGTPYELDASEASSYTEAIAQFLSRKVTENVGPIPKPGTKRGLMLSPSDLALIPNIPQDDIFDLVDLREGVVIPGLYRFVTCWSDLAVNVNTAPVAVLAALPRPGEDSVAFDIAKRRGQNQEKYLEGEQDRIGRFGEDPRRPGRALSQPQGAESAPPDPNQDPDEEVGYWEDLDSIKAQVPTLTDSILNDFRLNASVTSRTFSIYVEASMRGIRRVRRTIVRREGARFVPILTELVTWPRFREQTTEEKEKSDLGR
jgi:type II secretory pathway component PulK